MHWNYRVLDHGTHLALHEVFYDEAGAVTSWTAEPIPFVVDPEEGVAGLRAALAMALSDAENRPVLLAADLPGGG